GADRGRVRESLGPQSLLDGLSSIRPQIAVLAELATQAQHLFFPFRPGASGVVRGTGTVFPVHAVEALALGAFDPVQHGAGAHAKAASHGTDRLMLTNGSHHLATALGGTVCLRIRLSSGQLVFRYCSSPLFGMYWQRTVRDVLAVVPSGA